ncbi:MAG: type I-C CRISPR-associated protein Cas7/Csd2 [Blautia sp.]|nr:type I-C CRISPR-associated protein Cas7/Csd2 [Blautia sp.]
MAIQNKIDFAIIIVAENCNPNGDPLNGNRPRIDLKGFGEITDVAIKRKIRNRFQDLGQQIFVQADERIDDGFKSLQERTRAYEELDKEISKKKNANADLCRDIACKKWIDVRAFGQVFAFKGYSASVGVRGAVSIGIAKTLEFVNIRSIQITKSTNATDQEGKDASTMGTKHIIDKGVYVAYGSIFPQLAEKTGFSREDADLLKEALRTLFENDASFFRPTGSMANALYWWEHKEPSDDYRLPSSAKVFRTLHLTPQDEYPYYSATVDPLDSVALEAYDLYGDRINLQ